MGFREVILLGVDLSWVTTRGNEGDLNHFDPSYSAEIQDGLRERKRMRSVHQYAAARMADCGIRVFNASPNTWLDTFPLVGLEYILTSPIGDTPWKDQDTPAVKNMRQKISRYWREVDNLH
jgi:hypothetical protein